MAVGGYGRRELCPGSDVDVLVLHEGLEPAQLEEFARAVFHPLWDAGFKLGNAVRSTRQLVGDALDELDTTTAVLDGRVVAGDPARFEFGRAALVEKLSARPRNFLTALAHADTERRRRAGDAAEQLEPDVKSGAGGLRDVQSLRWAAAALVGEVGIDALVADGHVGATDAQRLHAAEDELLARPVGSVAPRRGRRRTMDEAIDDAVGAIESLPASVRLEALSRIQLRIMTGVTEEQAKRHGRS